MDIKVYVPCTPYFTYFQKFRFLTYEISVSSHRVLGDFGLVTLHICLDHLTKS